MKTSLALFILLLSTSVSALNCQSDDNPGKKLFINKPNGESLVMAEAFFQETENVFAGKVQLLKGSEEYTLFNQEGVEYTLVVDKIGSLNQPQSPSTHCQAKVCHTKYIKMNLQNAILSSQGMADENFTCY